ncbi:LIC12162 family protein [Gammaproteobacteria bacterium]|nr:LIC12162 family protein [Gammaproteobacteria bacterium]
MKLASFYPQINQEHKQEVKKLYEWNVDSMTKLLTRDLCYSDDSESLLSTSDRKFLEKIYDDNLSKLTSYLNKVHKLNYCEKNWEILVGPWLRIAVFSFYDRWLYVENLSKYDDLKILTQKFSLKGLVPKDFNDFHLLFYKDKWNAHIYALISEVFKIECRVVSRNIHEDEVEKKSRSSNGMSKLFQFIKSLFYIFAYNLLNILKPLNRGTILYNTTSYGDLAYLLLKENKGFPLIVNNSKTEVLLNESVLSNISRLRPLAEIKRKNNLHVEYDEFIFALLIMTIPSTYLEEFSKIKIPYMLNKFIVNPKTVFTSTSQWADDAFKKWLMENKKSDNDLKIAIWQHGGTYGTTEYLTHQEFIETKVYDFFLSWGWKSDTNKKIIPFKMPTKLKLPKLVKNSNKHTKLLVVLTRLKKYSKGDPWDSISWNKAYIKSLIQLSDEVYERIDCALTYRVHPSQKSTGLDIEGYIKQNTKESLFDQQKSLQESILDTRLTLVTQNSTVLLQLLIGNFPVICFWDLEISRLNTRASVEFYKLKKVGIFHENVNSVTQFIEINYKNINEWWFSEEVQLARREFCLVYAATSSDQAKQALNLLKL